MLDDLRFSRYINRRIFVFNPEFYIAEDYIILNSIISAAKKMGGDYSWFCNMIGLPKSDTEPIADELNENSRIRPVFMIDSSSKLTCLEQIHYRHIYKKIVNPNIQGGIIVCSNGCAYEYEDNCVLDSWNKIVTEINSPILIYGEDFSCAIYKVEKDFYNMLDRLKVSYRADSMQAYDVNNIIWASYLDKNEYYLVSRILDENFCMSKEKDATFYIANCQSPYLRFVRKEEGVVEVCDFLVNRYNFRTREQANRCWKEMAYEGCGLKFRYSFEDFWMKGLGVCADTALTCCAIFNNMGWKTYMVVFRGYKIRHAVCVIPEKDIMVSNMHPCKIDCRVGERSLVYFLSYFHIESIQVGTHVIYNEDFFEYNQEMMDFLWYVEYIYGSNFYMYLHSIHKSISFIGIKKILGLENDEKKGGYFIVSVLEQGMGIRVFLNNDNLLKINGVKVLCIFSGDKYEEYYIEEEQTDKSNRVVYIDACNGLQLHMLNAIKVYADNTVLEEVLINEKG